MARDQAQDFSIDEARGALAPARSPGMARVRSLLVGLAEAPPQVLLLEGGTEEERQAAARWWAALHHCESPNPDGPCGHCAACLHIGAGLHLDVLAYDGRISNKDDEENPGPVRAFNMDNARALKARIGDTPRSGTRRVVIMSGMDITRDAAANALLKVLEEPSPTTIFVLLAPQREQLLPTLVSRSWVLTLPWPDARAVHPTLVAWEEGLAAFLHQGRGWWQLTSTKGAVDQHTAGQVVLLCQKRLLPVLAAPASATSPAPAAAEQTPAPLTACFSRLAHEQRMVLCRMLDEAQEALQYTVNPARVLDWLAVRLFVLSRQSAPPRQNLATERV